MSLKLEHVNFIYDADTANPVYATNDVSLEIGEGEFIGLMGHTGSGKSTLIQHFNGLVKPSSGKIYFHGQDIYEEGFSLKNLRSKVGLVFQYPEHQLFEIDVLSDVSFGPKNQGFSKEEAEKKAKAALQLVGMGAQYYKKSPFELSGGQKRRVAIAGVLAMEPEILILDEPTAGLDPRGRDEILNELKKLHEEKHITIVLVSHSMEDIANYAQRIIVMDDGKILFDGTVKEVFRHYKELERVGLAAPQVTYLAHALKENGFDVDVDITTIAELKSELLKNLER
ncbi:MAG: energy-coupling factor transporter ATPase [Lachnospiraceae bacterium]